MTDIVERLRVEAKDWEGNDCTYHDLFTQAADEIERLRSCEEALREGGEIIIELKQEVERLRAALANAEHKP